MMLAGEQEFFCNSGWQIDTVEVCVVLSWSDEHHTLLFFPRLLAVLAPIFDVVISLLQKTSGIKIRWEGTGRAELHREQVAGALLQWSLVALGAHVRRDLSEGLLWICRHLRGRIEQGMWGSSFL